MYERTGERELLLHAAGQLIGPTRTKGRQLGHREQLIAPRPVIPHTVQFGEEGDVLVNGEIAVQAEALREVADLSRDGPVLAHGIVAEHAHLAAIGVQEAAHHADQGGLTRAVGTNQPEHVSTRHLERQVRECRRGPVPLDQLRQLDGDAHGSASSASTGMPCFNTPARLSTVTLMR